VVLRLHIDAEDIDLRVGQGNFLTIGLLHPDVTTQLAHLRESRHRCGYEKNGDRERSS
jgi:hypothetical protein